MESETLNCVLAVCEDGSLQKAPAPYDPLGPEELSSATYNLQRVGETHKGVAWGRQSGQRVLELTNVKTHNPAPSTYNASRPKTVGSRAVIPRATRLLGRHPREDALHTPGPNSYTVRKTELVVRPSKVWLG